MPMRVLISTVGSSKTEAPNCDDISECLLLIQTTQQAKERQVVISCGDSSSMLVAELVSDGGPRFVVSEKCRFSETLDVVM